MTRVGFHVGMFCGLHKVGKNGSSQKCSQHHYHYKCKSILLQLTQFLVGLVFGWSWTAWGMQCLRMAGNGNCCFYAVAYSVVANFTLNKNHISIFFDLQVDPISNGRPIHIWLVWCYLRNHLGECLIRCYVQKVLKCLLHSDGKFLTSVGGAFFLISQLYTLVKEHHLLL